MARYSSPSYGLLRVGPYDITSVTNKLEVSANDPIVDTTPFGATLAQFSKPGIKKYAIEGHEAWYDDATFNIHAAGIAGIAGTTQGFMLADRGSTAGTGVVMTQGLITGGWKRVFTVGDMTKAALEMGVTGSVDEGKLLLYTATTTGTTGNTESLDIDYNGASPATANGGWAFLSVNNITWGTATTLTVVAEDSLDANSYATIGTTQGAFAVINKGGGPTTMASECKVITGTVRRYVAAKWTFDNTGASCNITVALYCNP